VITAVACSAPLNAPLFLVAVAALPSPAPRTVALSPAGGEADWLRSLHEEHGGFPALERDGGRIVVLLPPRDGPEVRALALAAGSHLLWIDETADACDQAREFLQALHYSCDAGRIGWLRHARRTGGPVESLLRDWAAATPARSVTALGAWRPGEPLPAVVCGFLANVAPPPGAGPLSWAWQVLQRASLKHRAV
jgi:hypothetical protein